VKSRKNRCFNIKGPDARDYSPVIYRGLQGGGRDRTLPWNACHQHPVDTNSGFGCWNCSRYRPFIFMFKGVYRLDVSKFFRYTSILLIIFSAGLVAVSVHEFNEASSYRNLEHVWDVNRHRIPMARIRSFHDNGLVGGKLKALIGYDGNPSLTEVMAYIG